MDLSVLTKLGRGFGVGVVAVAALVWAPPLLAAPDVARRDQPPPSVAAAVEFEANRGQFDAEVRFRARRRGYHVFLTTTEAVLVLDSSRTVRMQMLGANPRPALHGLEPVSGTSNYFLSNDARRWVTGVRSYARVKYDAVYPGIDVVYYGNQGQVEYDFVVAPGADPSVITLGISGVDGVTVTSEGDLHLATPDGDLRLRAPLVYQEHDGTRQRIAGRYVILPSAEPPGGRGHHRVRFALGAFDRTRTLTIDPVLVYSTFLGGTGEENVSGELFTVGGIARDGNGNIYVTGSTTSPNFPTANAMQPLRGVGTAFVTKYDQTGARLYSTYLGGNNLSEGEKIAVDASGHAYVIGWTSSRNFPTAGALQAVYGGGDGDAFVAKLDPAGTSLIYSTYLGGANTEYGYGIAVDASGNAYVTGYTASINFPTVAPLQAAFGGGGFDGFIAKLNPLGSALVYSTYLGGTKEEEGLGIAVDASGNAYVTGWTSSSDFPVVRPIQNQYGGGAGDAYIVKLNPTGSGLVYATYLGGAGDEQSYGIAVDATGAAYIAGTTTSSDFPTSRAFQPDLRGIANAFITKVDPAGAALAYSTYFGGTGVDEARAITVSLAGDVFIAGKTNSANFPVLAAFQATRGGGYDAFVAKLSFAGTPLYATYLGGSSFDVASSITADTAGAAFVTGRTVSSNFPTASASQPQYGGGPSDAFVTKLSASTGPEIVLHLARLGADYSLRVTLSNLGPVPQKVQLKLWVDSPLADIPPSPDLGSTITAPPSAGSDIVSITLSGNLPFPGTLVGGRLIDPMTGATLSESVCTTVPCR